jgi:hypothetical protein
MRSLLFVIAILFSAFSFAQQCPPEGRAKSGSTPLDDSEKALNKAKNRDVPIPSGYAGYWDISDVINAAKHNDRADFTKGQYVYLEGYLIAFTKEKGESCNCYRADHNQEKYGDVHIYIGLTKNAKKKDCVVVEITPKYKQVDPEYLSFLQQAKGTQVRVFGYLLYDYKHEPNSANLCTTCTGTGVWRKTCWEIHPVVAIEQL